MISGWCCRSLSLVLSRCQSCGLLSGHFSRSVEGTTPFSRLGSLSAWFSCRLSLRLWLRSSLGLWGTSSYSIELGLQYWTMHAEVQYWTMQPVACLPGDCSISAICEVRVFTSSLTAVTLMVRASILSFCYNG